jgi:hypothetical protein
MDIADDGKYTKYSGYTPYSSYGSYASAVDAAAAKLETSRLNPFSLHPALNGFLLTSTFPQAAKRDMTMADDGTYTVYAGYKPYASYGPYSSAADETADTDSALLERSVNHPDASEMASGPKDLASATLPNNWYGKYE